MRPLTLLLALLLPLGGCYASGTFLADDDDSAGPTGDDDDATADDDDTTDDDDATAGHPFAGLWVGSYTLEVEGGPQGAFDLCGGTGESQLQVGEDGRLTADASCEPQFGGPITSSALGDISEVGRIAGEVVTRRVNSPDEGQTEPIEGNAQGELMTLSWAGQIRFGGPNQQAPYLGELNLERIPAP